MATKWSVDDLIANIKRRGVIPTAQMTYMLPDFKAMIDDELLSYALAILHSYREDYYIERKTVDWEKPDIINSNGYPCWRVPEYAIANSLRDLIAITSSMVRYNVPRLMLDDVPALVNFGWYFEGDYVVFRYDDSSTTPKPNKVEMAYHVRPNLVCMENEAWKILQVLPGSPTADETLLRVEGPDATGINQYHQDIIHGKSSFDVMARDLTGNGLDPTTVVYNTADLPMNIQKGDWISWTNTTPFPMLPSEMHGLLAQRVAVKFLEEQGEETMLKNAIENMVDLEQKVMKLFSPRVEGKPKKLVNRLGLWRRWRW